MRLFGATLTVLTLSFTPLLVTALSAAEIVEELARLDNITSTIRKSASGASWKDLDLWNDAISDLGGRLPFNMKISANKIARSPTFEGSDALDIFGAYFEISEDSQHMLKSVEKRSTDIGDSKEIQKIVTGALERYKAACKVLRLSVVKRFIPDSFESQEAIETGKDWRDAIGEAISMWEPREDDSGDDNNGDEENSLVSQSHRRIGGRGRGRNLDCSN
ncbi:hypothetical protein AA313_de0201525 [Arthrobotrys entomopaga]|nr:hypothetical protein AA313_de0201525 [Arthrobotrys entomopaga]